MTSSEGISSHKSYGMFPSALMDSTSAPLQQQQQQQLQHFNRRTGNHVFISTSFSGGPALQFGSLQRNIYSSYWTGLAPRHPS